MFGIRRIILVTVCLTVGAASAQDLEPRSFSQTPVGMNFVALSIGNSSGGVLFDQATTITDATGRVNSVGAAYVRTLSVLGASSKLTAVVPYARGHWEGYLDGDFVETSRTGFSDPKVMLAVNFIGAPAITMSQMRSYHKKTVVGASLQVRIPVGQYDPEKLINLGQNRWGFRPRLGMSRKTGNWSFELMGDVWLFTENSDFYGGKTVTQDPLWSLQANAIYQFPSGIWFGAALGGSRGGKVASDGVYGDSYQNNTRWAALFSYPLNPFQSLKLLYINGLRTRLGADFDSISLSYQIRWGGKI